LLRDLRWSNAPTLAGEPEDKRNQNEDVLGPIAGAKEFEGGWNHAPSVSESEPHFIPKLPKEACRSFGK
jgi:hypothetical protein